MESQDGARAPEGREARKTSGPYRALWIAGAIACILGVVLVVAGHLFNGATAGDGDANIGAGVMVLAGEGLAVCGLVVAAIGAVLQLATRLLRRRSSGPSRGASRP